MPIQHMLRLRITGCARGLQVNQRRRVTSSGRCTKRQDGNVEWVIGLNPLFFKTGRAKQAARLENKGSRISGIDAIDPKATEAVASGWFVSIPPDSYD
jgi:hypothetical protein